MLLERMRAEGSLSAAVPVIGIIKAPLGLGLRLGLG